MRLIFFDQGFLMKVSFSCWKLFLWTETARQALYCSHKNAAIYQNFKKADSTSNQLINSPYFFFLPFSPKSWRFHTLVYFLFSGSNSSHLGPASFWCEGHWAGEGRIPVRSRRNSSSQLCLGWLGGQGCPWQRRVSSNKIHFRPLVTFSQKQFWRDLWLLFKYYLLFYSGGLWRKTLATSSHTT